MLLGFESEFIFPMTMSSAKIYPWNLFALLSVSLELF